MNYLNHPERRKGEIFLGNDTGETGEGYFKSRWRTKRLGKTAYKNNGNPVSFLKPFFAKASEMKGYDYIDKALQKAIQIALSEINEQK
jgi:hypothetical protein